MVSILMWAGIALVVIGCIALMAVAFKRISAKDELAKFPDRNRAMVLRSNYCRLVIVGGIILLLISLVI